MAITSRFVADFAPFEKAVQDAEVSLKGLETGAERVEGSLNRMVDQFSGRKLIQDANLMVEAIERLGGVSQLTDKELERAGKTAAEAAEKMRALGMDVPEKLLNVEAAGKQTGGMFSDLTTRVGTAAAGFFTAQLALDVIKKSFDLATEAGKAFLTMVMEGSDVADLADNFERLSGSAERATGILDALRTGTHDTVSNMDLMTTASTALASGLNLTEDEFRTLAQGAFALSQATGVTVTDALKTMIDAMVTGKDRGLEKMGVGMIDLTAAEEAYAASLGATAKDLTETGKLEADRIAILDGVAEAVGRIGEQTDGLDEKVAQAQTQWANFTADLGASIATSDVLMAGITALGNEIIAAFGVDKTSAIETITRIVEDLAIGVLGLGDTFVTMGSYGAKYLVAIETQFNAIKAAMYAAEAGVRWVKGDTAGFQEFSAKAREAANEVGRVGEKYAAIDATAASAHAAIDRVRTAMETARAATVEHTTATAAAEPVVRGLGAAIGAQTGHLNENALASDRAREAKKLLKEADKDAQAYLEWELELYERQKTAAREVDELKQTLSDLNIARTGTATDIQILAIQRWGADYKQTLADAGSDTKEAYDLIDQIVSQRSADTMVNWDKVKSHSKEALQETADEARANYEAMLSSGLTFEVSTIEQFERAARQAQDAADQFGTSWEDGARRGKDAVKDFGDESDRQAKRTKLSWSEAMDAVGKGEGTMSGTVAGGPGTMTNYGKWGSEEHKAAIAKAYANGRYFGPVKTRSGGGYGPGYGGDSYDVDWEALGMAKGGPVIGGQPYFVGERGPELFVPSQGGDILPHGATGGTTVNAVFHVNGTGQDIARVVSAELTRMMRVGRKWPAV
jgi:hypothetical protein